VLAYGDGRLGHGSQSGDKRPVAKFLIKEVVVLHQEKSKQKSLD